MMASLKFLQVIAKHPLLALLALLRPKSGTGMMW